MSGRPPGASAEVLDAARKLTAEERALLEDLGYEVRQNVNNLDIVRGEHTPGFVGPDVELAFIRRVGEENVRALDAVGRLRSRKAAKALRRRFEAGDFSLDPEG